MVAGLIPAKEVEMMGEGIKLLLVEDRPEQRVALRKQLGLSKINAAVVGETGVAVEALAAAEQLDPDVILLSLEEPLVRPLRILESLAIAGGAPIMVLSSVGERDSLRKAMRAGAKEYLVKPVNPEELGQTIESVFAAEQRRRALLSGGGAGISSLGEVITILGPKGGIGKTTLATNLAIALFRETKQHVVLLDLNLELGDVSIALDIVPERTILDVIRIIDRLEPELVKRFLCEHSSGIQVLAAGAESKTGGVINDHNIGKIIEVLAKGFDYVVVDTAPRLHGTFPSVVEQSNMVLVVTTPEPPCLKNTKKMLETLKAEHSCDGKVKLVVNDAYNTNGMPDSELGTVLDYPIFWKMPHDSLIGQCVKAGKPCVEAKAHGKISRNITKLARTLSGIEEPRRVLFRSLRK